jgi:predicted nucleic acid-binding protein
MAAILVDTGTLYAIADSNDTWHRPMETFLQTNTDTLIVPITILPEVCYLLNTYLGQEAERKFIECLLMEEMKIESMTKKDLRRSLRLLESYVDANIGFVDASLIAIAERLKIRRILTTDRRDFSIIRPSHCHAFDLLP